MNENNDLYAKILDACRNSADPELGVVVLCLRARRNWETLVLVPGRPAIEADCGPDGAFLLAGLAAEEIWGEPRVRVIQRELEDLTAADLEYLPERLRRRWRKRR